MTERLNINNKFPLPALFCEHLHHYLLFPGISLVYFSTNEGGLQLILQNPKSLYPQFKCLSNADWHLKLLTSVAEERV